MSHATSNQQNTLAKRAPPPAFDPERPMLVQPWREFEGRGWVEVQYLGGAISRTVQVRLLGAPLLREGESPGLAVGPQEAKDRIVKAGLWSPGRNKAGSGKKQADKLPDLPKKSICKKDFEGSDESLLARARSVAQTLGERTAAGRIGSMELTRQGKQDFASWWDGAGAERKARLLTDQRHFDSLSSAEKKKLNSVLSDCPFRGDGPVPHSEKEQGKDKVLPVQLKVKQVSSKEEGKGKSKARAIVAESDDEYDL
jgi:hypothetical protein